MDEALPLSGSAVPQSPEITLGEEVAGSPVAAPVARTERIPILDVIRGFALLGILLMNIVVFSGPSDMGGNPTTVGHHDRLNIAAWVVCGILFEGKMRGAFSMLFGAGVILLTDRAEARGLGARVGDIFTRRNMWLVLFGVLDGYLLWFGDILYWYGLLALLFLYPFRKANSRTLWIAGLVSLLLVEIPMAAQYFEKRPQANLVAAAHEAQQAGKKLTKEQSDALNQERKSIEDQRKERAEDLKRMRSGYWQITQFRAKQVNFLETQFLYFFGFGDSLGMMLIGMALLRAGFLSGSMPSRFYVRTALICYPLVILIAGFGVVKIVGTHFRPSPFDLYLSNVPYEIERSIGTLANISVVILICKKGWLKPLTRRLAAVGQMALTNYLLTSVLCVLYFYGYGLKHYGELEYYQLFYVVAAVWAVLLVASPLWLQHYQFGPMEWLWRSLTYWRRQPMRLRRPVTIPLDQLPQPA